MSNLILDVDEGSLMGYKVASQISKEFMGNNLDEGYALHVLNDQISAIFICFRAGYDNFNKFQGKMIKNQIEFYFDENSTFEDVVSVLGEPTDQWNDGVEMCAEFTDKKKEIEVIWSVDGKNTLDYMSIEPVTRKTEP